VDSENGSALIFSFPLLKAYVETKTVFIDGTFRTVPSLFYQLVTLHVKSFNKVLFLTLHANLKLISSVADDAPIDSSPSTSTPAP